MEKIQGMDEANSGDGTLRIRIGAVLQLIHRFTSSVGPCVQYSPHLSLAVGGFNCVLLVSPQIIHIFDDTTIYTCFVQLALGYLQFFDDLTGMIERIGEHLQYLTEYSLAVFQSSPIVQNVSYPRA